MMHKSIVVLSALLLAVASTDAVAQSDVAASPCGSLESSYGPWDYRTDGKMLAIVHQFHFTPLVEQLIKPMSTNGFAADFDYTLKTSPNHHRALIAMAKNSLRLNDVKPYLASYTVDCYFERAMRFRPDDLVVRMIYADYLVKANRSDEAVVQLDYASSNAGDNAFTHYNLGQLYLEAKAYDKAVASAREAERLGFARDDLKKKLVAAGKWADATPSIPAAPAASAARQ